MKYTDAGLNLEIYAETMAGILPLLARTWDRARVVTAPFPPRKGGKGSGGFASLFDFNPDGRYKNPVLVNCTDGVGSKLKIAQLMGKYDTVGIDLVAMSVNDLICTGGEPLVFLDYLGMHADDTALTLEVMKGISAGCVEAGCSLTGGETAILPDFYAAGDFDLAGFCTGVVERDAIIDGRSIQAGDVVLGLPALQLLESKGYALHIVGRGKWAPALLAGYPWDVHVQPNGLRQKIAQLRQLRRACSEYEYGFDQRENAFLLPVSISSALEMRMAGLNAVGVAKEGRSPLLARAEPWATQGHELTRYWDIACRFVRHVGPPPDEIGLRVPPGKEQEAAQHLAAHGVHGRFLMIAPFAGGRAATADKAEKKWPGFEDFVREAPVRLGLPVVVCPGPGEHEAARQLYPAAVRIDDCDLGVYVALLQRAALVVANDTGPGHMAAALARPLISMMGGADAPRWAPWGPNVHVLQHPRQNDQVVWPDAEEALSLAERLLAETT